MEKVKMGKIGSRVVIRDGLAYFSGHVDGKKHKSMREQATSLFKRYDELLAEIGSDKYHLLSAEIYISDINLKDELNEAWIEWQDNEEYLPRRLCVQVVLEEGYLIEMTVTAEIINVY